MLSTTNSYINYFAQTDFRGRKINFGIKDTDRSKHVYVIGKTGMGKSTLLENMAIQDIKNGAGMAFIDPHGKTAELLLDFVPADRREDVIYFAPYDLDYPISFNVMEDVGPDQRYLVANGLMASFKKIWPDVWSARMEYILGNTLLALLEYPNSTLLGVNRMLSDKAYREMVVANISDPTVKSFWVDEFANYNERYMQEAGDAIKNKIGQFTSNPLIRNIIGQAKSSINLRQVMDEKKILIINLSKGRVGEQNASLLGGMLITKIYLAAMSRAGVADSELRQLPPFYLFVDEFQSFVNDSFADILSEARKYKLSLTIAHQYIEQMPETVRNAVFGNVGTTICFRVGPFDAEVMEKIFNPAFVAEDLVNLGFAQIYLTLSIDGVGSAPFSATTLPPIVMPSESLRQEIIDWSRGRYAKKRSDVEEAIALWHEEIKKEPAVAKTYSPKLVNRITEPPVVTRAITENQSRSNQTPVQPIKKYSHHESPIITPSGLKPFTTAVDRRPTKISLDLLNNKQRKGHGDTTDHEKNKAELRKMLAGVMDTTEQKVTNDVTSKTNSSQSIKQSPSPVDQAKTTSAEVPESVLRKMLEI